MTSNSQLSYLDRVVMEIVETERTYVCDLRMIVQDYLSHIIDQSVSLSPDQVVSLFGNIEDIYEFNSELLQCLDLCGKDPVAVARCFVTKREDFAIYTQFCNNYPRSVAALTDCMRSKTLAKFFRDRQATLQKPLPLGSYLLKPVQRILKYHLLLQEIAKNFNQDDEGFEVIEEAICTMTGVACYINDMKRKHEHAVRLQEVQSLLVNWKGPDLTTFGELVLEGTFKLHGAKNQRTLFLFQQLLLITRRRADHFIYKTHISCSTLMLIDTKDSRSFSVTHYKRPKKPHTVQARTVEERELWAHHIKRIILENHHAVLPQKVQTVAPGEPEALSNHQLCLCAVSVVTTSDPPRYQLSPERPRKMAPAEGGPERQSGDQTSFSGGVDDSFTGLTSGRTHQAWLVSNSAAPDDDVAEFPERRSVPMLEGTEASEPGCGSDPSSSSMPELDVEEPAVVVADSRALSSGESSDDEDREKDPPRILPPSVLNQAGDIANHVSCIRRPSWVRPQTPRSTGGLHTPVSELAADPGRGRRSEPDGFAGTPEGRRYSDSGGRQRRDSFLTRHDRLLIGKIKSYYESAATQDSSLGLQRRESLNHIPTGLVRTSVSRFNNAPDVPACSASEASCSAPLGPTVSRQASDPAGLESVEEEFRPSSEIIRIWQTMEQQTASVTSLDRQLLKEASGKLILASEPSASPLTPQDQNQTLDNSADEVKTPVGRRDLLAGAPKSDSSFSEDLQATWGKSEPEGSEAAEDRTESKVLHLARCYSQRLRESKPAVSVRSPEIQMNPSSRRSLSEESPADDLAQNLNRSAEAAQPVAPALTRASAGFHWPDVQELRSKYSEHTRSTAPDLRRPRGSAGSSMPERGPELDPSVHREDMSAPQLSTTPSSESDLLLDRRCGRPHDAVKVMVLEKGPERETGVESSGVEEQTYVQIRSPTSREKISILAVVDRCRAYQDSKEYKHRETMGTSGVRDENNIRPKTPAEQNLVKNLREKFQKNQ
ncbi:pleckstrin homology domain-containing family G member 3-like [Neosynchiropus ocellatus]